MSDSRIQLCLVLHNHQPVGNFDDVIEQAYRQSYLPFLDVFAPYTSLKISLHTSGPLLLWLEEHYPEYLNRLANLVAQERVEIIGGAFYEPILSMIPSRDRGGQISRFSNWLNNRFHTEVRGMWIPERVWETSLVSNIAGAGIEYTVLDDFHFRCAGLGSDDLLGSYVTEDQGHTLRVYPGSEQLRYAIPFQEPSATIDHLREIQHQLGSATVVFADDGEKFGSWPDTYKHVYDEGWLKRFFDTLVENQDWLTTTTLGTATRSSIPQGNIYLPDASYREMTEWSLPTGAQLEYEEIRDEFENDWRWPKLKKFIRGGFWRNFKRKYSETNEMYSRMMYVSKRLEQAEHTEHCDHNLLDQAKDHLYRGQCNCAYWHGAFGGVYLPHLRNAVFRHLILADNLIERAIGADGWSLEAGDFNFDQRAEVRLSNDDLVCWICPSRGGHMYELDIRSLCHNLLATMQRRPEAYHEKVKQGQNENSDSASSIHDRVVFKQDNLDQMLVYDWSPRKSLVDHFWPVEVKLDDVANGKADELGDFVEGKYDSTLRRNPDRNQVLMTREGCVNGQTIKITKGVTLSKNHHAVSIAYLLERIPENLEFHFGVEFNFAGLPANVDDRYFQGEKDKRLGHLGQSLDLTGCSQLGLVDEWLGIHVDLTWDQQGGLWTFPIQSVSQSEGGFELVHQSAVVQPHWMVRADQNGRWAVKLKLGFKTPAVDTVHDDQPAVVSETN